MYYKKIVPIQVLNLYATEFMGIFPLTKDCSVRLFEIEFYNEEGHPLLSRKGKISGLPINEKLVENLGDKLFTDNMCQEAREMFDAQNKIIMDEIKKIYGLTYYDDTFERNDKKDFSYTTYVNL